MTFELSPPFRMMVHCHCSRCRKSSGIGHATNLVAEPTPLRWLSGEADITCYLPTARSFGKWFCHRCGCPLLRLTRDGALVVIPGGSLDEEPAITPTDHIFWSSRVAWACPSDELPTHAGYPAAWRR
ncbi:MAG: GFA family protein [Piscinibacter sp.]|uniref:GFA family protein n=1 Tax=Piscinibacter sp. TaxID=1903157 RepID=UPI00259062F5|nr:GFA family protein [Piscinibacter sp.]MCW5662889.1 GFA family protein [Piscinibacter sp.]